MIRKFNLTNGVSVVITEELALKYELDNVHSDAAFIGVLAGIVAAQDLIAGDFNGCVPLWALTTVPIDDAARGMLEADDETLKRRFFGERIEPEGTVYNDYGVPINLKIDE